MDFKQVEKNFEKLKAQFEAGTLSEAMFKNQLDELMLQDEQGNWWMIGYETEKWYRHDGKNWVQAVPPGTGSKIPTPSPLEQENGTNTPATNPDDQRSVWKFGKKEIIQSAIGLGVFTVLYFLFGRNGIFFTWSFASSYWSLAFAVPLFFGMVFGPIVGATVGAGSYIIYIISIFYEYTYVFGNPYPFHYYFSTTALFATAMGGFIMGFAKTRWNTFHSFKSILRVELFIILAILTRFLLSTDGRVLFDNFSYATRDIRSALAWSLILVLVPIILIVYSFILSRRQARI